MEQTVNFRQAARRIWNKWLYGMGGQHCLTCELSDEYLVQLLGDLGSSDPERDLLRVRQGHHTLLGTTLHLLSGAQEISDGEFVRRTYKALLKREVDGEGFHHYLQALTSGPMSRAEFVAEILCSPEFRPLAHLAPFLSRSQPGSISPVHAFRADLVHRIVHPNPLLPPLSMRHCISGEISDSYGLRFELMGRHFAEKLLKDEMLNRNCRVLDLGSGCGRIAIPLTEMINNSGCYFGLEVKKPMVEWCQEKITPRFPHFRFIHANVYSGNYNPRGTHKPEAFQFPLENDRFDLVVATSVFTHLLPEATRNYIGECARVLKAGGKLFATFFLIENGTSSADGKLCFSHGLGNVALSIDPVVPENAVAYRTNWLLEVFRQARMELVSPVRWGYWTGKHPGYSGQDVVILQKQ